MNCPKCHNRNFTPSADFKKPIQNLGNKQHYMTFDTRRYICIQCGHKWITKEEWYRDIDLRKINESEIHAHQ